MALSKRQREVLERIRDGMTFAQIAHELQISERTARHHYYLGRTAVGCGPGDSQAHVIAVAIKRRWLA